MAAWPGTLPDNFETRGYSETDPDETMRTRMEVGPDKVRRATSSTPRVISGSMIMTDAQVATLRTFVATTTNGGVDQFDFTYGGGTESVRFLNKPSYKFIVDGYWSVSFSFEVFV